MLATAIAFDPLNTPAYWLGQLVFPSGGTALIGCGPTSTQKSSEREHDRDLAARDVREIARVLQGTVPYGYACERWALLE